MSSVVNYLETLFDEKAASASKESDNQSIYAKLTERFGLAEGESVINTKI